MSVSLSCSVMAQCVCWNTYCTLHRMTLTMTFKHSFIIVICKIISHPNLQPSTSNVVKQAKLKSVYPKPHFLNKILGMIIKWLSTQMHSLWTATYLHCTSFLQHSLLSMMNCHHLYQCFYFYYFLTHYYRTYCCYWQVSPCSVLSPSVSVPLFVHAASPHIP